MKPAGRLARLNALRSRPAWSLNAPLQKPSVSLSVGKIKGPEGAGMGLGTIEGVEELDAIVWMELEPVPEFRDVLGQRSVDVKDAVCEEGWDGSGG